MLRLVRLAFLSPEILTAIFAGKAAVNLDVTSLTMPNGISLRWDDQRRTLAHKATSIIELPLPICHQEKKPDSQKLYGRE